jgi:hypothetical protein
MSLREPDIVEPLAVLASDDTDYERLGLARDAVAPWEDGARTGNRRGTYEWWYFDAQLDDGSRLVVTFMNKDIVSPNDSLTPTIRIDLDVADADPDMAGIANAQARVVAANVRALITGRGSSPATRSSHP